MLYHPLSEIIARGPERVLRSLGHSTWLVGGEMRVFAAAGAPLADDAPEPGRIESSDGRSRLLVVEDDWFVSMDVESTLVEAGYEVVELVRSADEAVRAAVQHLPDLVLMDIRLLGSRDGVDAAHEIRKKADIPCLFVSAHTDETTRARAAASRPAGWLMKPFLAQHLLEAVESALGRGDDEAEPA